MSILGSFGGGFGFDSDLGSKIDKLLAGKPSAKQKVEEFLVEELHIDPSKLPLTLKDARTLINEMMSSRDAESVVLWGTSMGLAHVTFTLRRNTYPLVCPHCGYTGGMDDRGNGQWECYDCEQQFPWTKPATPEQRLDEQHPDSHWPELLRIYTAFRKHVRAEIVGDAPDCKECGTSNTGSRDTPHLCEDCEKKLRPKREPSFSKFKATSAWGEANVEGLADKKPRWKRPEKYPTGAQLRITNGTETLYVMVGGPFSNVDITNLASMKPIKNVSAYSVVEVLDDGSGQ